MFSQELVFIFLINIILLSLIFYLISASHTKKLLLALELSEQNNKKLFEHRIATLNQQISHLEKELTSDFKGL